MMFFHTYYQRYMDIADFFRRCYFRYDTLGLAIDFSHLSMPDDVINSMLPKKERAFEEMSCLEGGDIVNVDEKRMVGHYWLRSPDLSPSAEIHDAIINMRHSIQSFADDIRAGRIVGESGKLSHILWVGIGGSCLGPQLIADSLVDDDSMKISFIDNTDPDGICRILSSLSGKLEKTLVVVASKSGSTPEPRNAMKEIMHAYKSAGLSFARHAVAITGNDSLLDKQARQEGWIARFPMWDWVGGRTSIFSAVGLLCAALLGVDIGSFVSGAHDMDILTRQRTEDNPAIKLAMAWYIASNGHGQKDMVVLPYKDRLGYFARYLQQLVMESLGKSHDREGQCVRQGLTVYGNKGTTDQHAFVQQLRDGIQNFFVTVITVLKNCNNASISVDNDGMTSGDYLNGFALGTIDALSENRTPIIHIILDDFNAYALGMLIALYERAVGFYASFININAYHQPGVEAGKKAAAKVLKWQKDILDVLRNNGGTGMSISSFLDHLPDCRDISLLFKLLEHMVSNGILKYEKPCSIPHQRQYIIA